MAEKGLVLPKFGEWDVNDPASAEGFTVIFNKARNEKRTGGKPESPSNDKSIYSDDANKHISTLGEKPHSKKWFCCMQSALNET
ncbi:Protein noi4 [Castilleja foliolosa]|uniref:Protein noi4 n=1 Tax=Castilleja foliolosa TaxID=1961234 RepID=A0ABD3C4W8_9LAMI